MEGDSSQNKLCYQKHNAIDFRNIEAAHNKSRLSNSPRVLCLSQFTI